MQSSAFRTPHAALILALACTASAQQRLSVFDAPLVITDEHHVMTQIADLDGDGDTDAIGFWSETQRTATWTQTGQLTAWLNDGEGKLVQTWELQPVLPFSPPLPVVDAVGDLNRDGLADYVLASSNMVRVYFSNGAALPTERLLVLGALINATDLLVADLTHDGYPDLLVAHPAGLRLFEYDGVSDTLLQTSALATSALGVDTPQGIRAAELDGSPGLEFFGTVGTWVRMYSAALGVLTYSGSLFIMPVTPPMFASGDIDGDGDEDIVDFGMGQYSVLRRTGPTSWSLEAPRNGGPATHMADVDGDGDLDGVCCGGGGGGGQPTYTTLNTAAALFRVTHNDGTGNFAPAIEFPGLGAKHVAGIADLEGDGDMDLVGGRCVYYPPSPIRATVTFEPALPVLDAKTLLDLDRDGDLDYCAGLSDLRCNLGDGTHTSWANAFPPAPAGGTWIGAGFPGDFDGDGDIDLLVGLAMNGGTSLELLANRGGGAYAHALQSMAIAPQSMEPRFGFTADVDGDGDLDFVWRSDNAYHNGTDFYANDGTGRLSYATTVAYTFERFGDLNGDPLPDLLLTYGPGVTPTQLFLRLNLGGMSFGSMQPLLSLGHYHGRDHFAVADLDSDGDDDVAAIDRTSNAFVVQVAWNDGLAGFTVTTLPGGNGTINNFFVHLAAFDADADGRSDLLVSSDVNARAAIDVHLRRHDNTGWRAPIRHAVWDLLHAPLPEQAFIGFDLDGDGDNELIHDQILWGRQFIPATSGRRRQWGASEAGSGGSVPTLGASGPFRSTGALTLRLTGARPLTSGRLFMTDMSSAPVFPTLGVNPRAAHGLTLVVPFTTGAGDGSDGSGEWTLAGGMPSSLIGRTLRYDAELDDPAGPGGRVRTNTLELVIGL